MKKIWIIVFLINSAYAAENVLTWEECVAEAKKNHPELTAALERSKQAKLDMDAISSKVYPQTDVFAGASIGKETNLSEGEIYSAGISANQLLYDGNKTQNERAKALALVSYEEAVYKEISTQIRQRLRLAFTDCLKYKDLVKLTEEIITRRKQNLELVTMRYDAGREHKGSLLTAKASLKEAEYEARQAARNLDIAFRRLSRELGRKEFMPINIKGDFNLTASDEIKKTYQDYMEELPKILEWKAEEEALGFEIKSGESEYKPKVTASLDASLKDASFPPQEEDWSTGLKVTYPLFDGDLRKSNLSKSKSKLKETNAKRENEESAIILELEETWLKMNDARENVGVRKDFLEAVRERSKIAQAQYSNGLITFDNWTLIEDDWVNAKKSYLNAEALALVAEANWIQARGGTLDEN